MDIKTKFNIDDVVYMIDEKDFTIDKIKIVSIEVYIRRPPESGLGESATIETSVMYNLRSTPEQNHVLREEYLKDIFVSYEDAIVELEKRVRERITKMREESEKLIRTV